MNINPAIAPRARKNHTAILQALAEIGQARVAELIGESDATVSRFKGDLERCSAIMAAIGLKAVPEGQRYYSDERIRAYITLAKIACDLDGSSEWGSV